MADNPIKNLEAKIAEAEAGGGPGKVAKQHESGKKTARERIDYLLDLQKKYL